MTLPEPWERYADALLHAHVGMLLAAGREPDAYAGLYVSDDAAGRLAATEPAATEPAAGTDAARADDVALAAAAAGLAASLGGDSPFAAACALSRLSPADAQVLALLLAVEVDAGRQRLVGYAQDDVTRPRVTLALLRRLLPPPHPGVLAVADDGRLRRARLVTVEPDGPWAVRALGVASGLVWALLGDAAPVPGLPTGARVRRGPGRPAEPGTLRLACGADRHSRLQALAEQLGGAGLLVTPPAATPAGWDAVVLEATLGGLAVAVDLGDAELPPELRTVVAHADHVAWGIASTRELPLESLPDVRWQETVLGSGEASEEEWLTAVGEPPLDGARLDREQLRLVAAAGGDTAAAVRRLAGGHLDRLTRRVRPSRGWDDLVLAPALRRQVEALLSRHRHRRTVYDAWGFPPVPSSGTVALFSGPSGTGKTLTAEVVAGELGLDLFVLDLSTIMSKYIGETEKNLSALFDAAECGDAVLFFDEADALFGKRSAVTDARDRYANVEVSYLLQRLEQHSGLVLLATNLPANIDEAFLRRLHASIEFVAPDEAARRGIWARAFPPGCPTKDLDLDLLARDVDLNGGPVASAALAAAFAAAAADGPVTMRHVADAVEAEYRKQGRLAGAPLVRS